MWRRRGFLNLSIFLFLSSVGLKVFSNHMYGEKLLNLMHPDMRYKFSADQFSLH
jgi:hypothetical protein